MEAMIEARTLEAKVAGLLEDFFQSRRAKLGELRLVDILRRKNPYLYRARGVSSAAEIVREILEAFVTSSDEGVFGNVFFEPLAKWAAEEAARGSVGTVVSVSGAQGVDVTIEDAVCYAAIAVKSGIHVFNAQSRRRQAQDFEALRSRMAKLGKRFDAIVGYSYGRKRPRADSETAVKELAGQAFWRMLTGEDDFYTRFMQAMKELPRRHAPLFQEEFAKAENRLVREFLFHFSGPDGGIDWMKLAEFNSGSNPPKLARFDG
jgi:hypothetical protein